MQQEYDRRSVQFLKGVENSHFEMKRSGSAIGVRQTFDRGKNGVD